MKIKLKKKENQYAQVHVNMLRDRALSLKAKGLGAVLESYSNDFDVSLKSIEINSNDGAKSIKNAIKELENGYYLFRFQTHDSSGKFVTYWAFDSQKLEVEYLKSIIKELERVDHITKNDLLSPGYQKGRAVDTVTGVPFTGDGKTIDGKSVGGSRTTYNNNTNQNRDYKNNPNNNQGLNLKKKVNLNLSKEASEFREKLLTSGYVGHLAPVMVEGEREDVYINQESRLYTKTRTDRQIVSSTLNEIWEQLLEINGSRVNQRQAEVALQDLKIKKIGA